MAAIGGSIASKTSPPHKALPGPQIHLDLVRRTPTGDFSCKTKCRPSCLGDARKAEAVLTLITQNVYGLHDLAGSKNVIKLHGDIWTVRCLKCGEERVDRTELNDLPPHCRCGGMLRPGVVWFGEALPEGAIQRATAAVRAADVLIVAGTSAQVYPAAGLIPLASAVIEINPEETPFSDEATFSLRGTSAALLPQLL